jgi:hypothetical protein
MLSLTIHCLLMTMICVIPLPAQTNSNFPAPVTFTAEQDHQNMLDQLGIKALRPGPSGDEKAPNHANFHEKASSVNKNLSLARSFGGSRKGACPLAGGAAFFAAWGEPARPGFPLWGNGKGELKVPSLLPQAMNSVYSHSITSLHNRRFALLPFALFVEQLAPVPVGVLNIVFGCCHLRIRTDPLREERRS